MSIAKICTSPKRTQTDVVFLERDINARKHAFGIEVYDLLKSGSGMPEVQKAFEACQSDIAHLEAKVDAKKGEMQAIDGSGTGGGGGVEDAETPGIPSTP